MTKKEYEKLSDKKLKEIVNKLITEERYALNEYTKLVKKILLYSEKPLSYNQRRILILHIINERQREEMEMDEDYCIKENIICNMFKKKCVEGNGVCINYILLREKK